MEAGDTKAVVRRYFEEFHNGRQHDIIVEIIDPELVEPTREATRKIITGFPDYRFTIDDQIGEGDRVATVWSAEGTHQGEWDSPIGGIPASGKQLTWTGTTTVRVTNGKISGVIGSNHDHLGILQQIGVLAATAPRPGA